MLGVELRIWDTMMGESSLGPVFVSIQASDKDLSNLMWLQETYKNIKWQLWLKYY